MKIINFRGDLTDNSAKKEALDGVGNTHNRLWYRYISMIQTTIIRTTTIRIRPNSDNFLD